MPADSEQGAVMAFTDLAEIRKGRPIVFLLLLTFSFNVSSDAQISDIARYRSRRNLPIFKAHVFVERKLVDSAVPVNTAPAPSPSTLLPPPPPPSHRRPALVSPDSTSPGADLPPKELPTPPPPSGSQTPAITSSASSTSSRHSNVAVILGVTLGALAILLVTLSVAAYYFRPHWLPFCRGRSIRYERHFPNLG